jgi:hypothetical protein
MSAAAAPAPATIGLTPADFHLPTLYVGPPPLDSVMPGPDVLLQEEWEKLSPSERQRFTRLCDLPFTADEVQALTALLHEEILLRQDINFNYDRLYEGELSDERRQRLEDTLAEHERRATSLEARLAEGNRRILEALQRRKEWLNALIEGERPLRTFPQHFTERGREPANWDDLPEDPILPLVLNETQRAVIALVNDTLAFNAAYAAGAVAGAGTACTCTCTYMRFCEPCSAKRSV